MRLPMYLALMLVALVLATNPASAQVTHGKKPELPAPFATQTVGNGKNERRNKGRKKEKERKKGKKKKEGASLTQRRRVRRGRKRWAKRREDFRV
jgi:hypothetical protein